MQQQTAAFTVRTNEEKLSTLDELAMSQERSRNFVVNEAIDYLIDLHNWQKEKIESGLKDVANENFATEDEVTLTLNKYLPK